MIIKALCFHCHRPLELPADELFSRLVRAMEYAQQAGNNIIMECESCCNKRPEFSADGERLARQ